MATTYEIRAISPADRCNKISLGQAHLQPLKTFLKSDARRFHEANIAKTFVMVESADNCVVGYATLLCTHVSVEQFGEAPVAEYRYRDYPAVKLARLAVDQKLQGSGAGSTLVDFVIGLVAEHVMPNAGCRFLILDAKPNSVGFYTKKGFTTMGQVADGGNALTAMFVDLHRLGSA